MHNETRSLCLRHKDSSAVDPDNWFKTGDVASIDPLGFMRITDRSKDVIKSGGEWISSIDIENAAMSHEHVSIPLAQRVCLHARCLLAGQKLKIHMRDEGVLQMGQCTLKDMDAYTFTGQSYTAVSLLVKKHIMVLETLRFGLSKLVCIAGVGSCCDCCSPPKVD